MARFGTLKNTVRMQSGIYFDLKDPQPDMVNLDDIFHGLSRMPRFLAQTQKAYTVLDHSFSMMVNANYNEVDDRSVLKAILLHDATEAYIGDISSPLKDLLGPVIEEIESRIEKVIGIALKVDFAAHHDVIKKYDRTALIAEKNTLRPSSDEMLWAGESEYAEYAKKYQVLGCGLTWREIYSGWHLA